MGRLRGFSIPATAIEPRPDDLTELVSAAAGGDPDAAATLIVHVGASMLRVVRKVLGRDHADVDDVAQDAVLAFLDALAGFRGECSVIHFAQRIALLTAFAARRQTSRRRRWWETQGQLGSSGGAAEAHAEAAAASPLALTLASRRRALVLRLLDELPEVVAEALALHFVLGYTVDEIAAAAAISPNTVWSRLRLGKQALRRRLAGDAQLLELVSERGDSAKPKGQG
jgi:RNA polymerase sigma-70 factor (ECF subfamily)